MSIFETQWSKFIFVILYVDNILLATNNLGLLYEMKRFLFNQFKMKDMSETRYEIGIEIFQKLSIGKVRFVLEIRY